MLQYRQEPLTEAELESDYDYVHCYGCGCMTHISKIIMAKYESAPHWLLCSDCLRMKLGMS